MDLSGTWLAMGADEGLRRRYPEPDFDDSWWAEIEVPGHWRSNPAFAGHDGPLLYRRRFEAAADNGADTDARRWLVLDGAFYQTDVWLDGSYIGDTEGYFFPHTFEVTGALADRTEHVLGIEVACNRPSDKTAKRNITGVFEHWDCLDPDWNPGGLWRPVRVEETGPVRISRLRVLCAEATTELAVLTFRTVLDAAAASTVELRTTVGERDFVEEHTLAAGENRIEWRVGVESPSLWWPHALGEPHLTDVSVEVVLPDAGHRSSHRRALRTGLRQVRMKDWITTVNGERLFLKGANQGPTRMALADAKPDELEADVVAAKEAGLDLLRLHAHVTRPELYEAADRHGLLLWQDMPLQWGYKGIRKQAARQAREAVDLLGHHPSIAMWCGHNEPLALANAPGEPEVSAARFLALQELPTWNRSILDRSVARALEKSDRTRPVIAHSGVLPGPTAAGTDSHLYFGWYHGDERDLPGFAARIPRMVRFVSEFGSQSVPETADFLDADRWPALDWGGLERTHNLQKVVFERVGLAPEDFPDLASWREATQRYQADLLRFHIETLRRLKYRPTGGFCQFMLADGHPGVTWSLLDHERKPKLGLAALRAVCAPVIVVADRPAVSYAGGDLLDLDVHVVSDLRHQVASAVVTADLTWPGGGRSWRWEGDIPADSCVRVGTVGVELPARPGPLSLEVRVTGAGADAAARYDSVIGA
jgi:beta-mannosidase